MTKRRSKTTATEPTTWRATINGRPFEITAAQAKISTAGVLVFADANGRLVKAFAAGTWAALEAVGDLFANPIVFRSDNDH